MILSFHSNISSNYSCVFTAWKMSKYEVASGPYFPVFNPNGPEITPYLDTFHTVLGTLCAINFCRPVLYVYMKYEKTSTVNIKVSLTKVKRDTWHMHSHIVGIWSTALLSLIWLFCNSSTREVKFDAIFVCFISVALTEYLLENLHVFYSFKVQHVSNFTIIEEENIPYWLE